MSGLLMTGTSSDAGKSALVTGLCRIAARRGIDVVPFKAQNMSNNSMVCPDGAEIGRAQYLQATAAGVVPAAGMNPVLLKPGTDRRSFIVLMGSPAGELDAGEYATGRRRLAEAAFDAYAALAAEHDLVICEGAGSPAEINLRSGDYVNMGLARRFNLPTVIIGDIDRGGVLASLYGTWALLDEPDRALLRGYVINKFRGDASVLAPGLAEISARTGMTGYGVLPWLAGVWIDGEDALNVDRWAREEDRDRAGLRVAAIRLPRISNATDVEALAAEPGVDVQVTDDPSVAERADLLVLPGSRSTVSDLAWLNERGLGQIIAHRHAQGRPVLGICGGYEMLAQRMDDEIESGAGVVPGLGLLPVRVRFDGDKTVRVATYTYRGMDVTGYEIHHGLCEVTGGEPFLDGVRSANTWGTMLHGSLENDAFRRALLSEVAAATGSGWTPDENAPGYARRREQMIETLADAMEEHLDIDALLALAEEHA
ncbi:CobBQ-type GATase domain profile [Propionibacterium ruminifibrarum]|uniref:Cobyric acid synthase n=1 Tax=Propionibacterium ruminifibrarum TaxID=1962131 RepID=A0A375HYH8_9ACTN|nr:cobyric acid synthase [Propionibacterium ruminifibrarum]SPF67341.1 CobBQ-type GATase domain profile [Propionibacterium ruminifibrarum]